MQITVQPLTHDHIRAYGRWQYEPPYDLYNVAGEESENLAFFSDPANGYFALVNEEGDLLGTCNFGADGQVPGGQYDDSAIDVGISMRPDLTGQGLGHIYAGVVFDFARQQFPGQKLRVTIAEFNGRSQRVCEKHGFHVTQHFLRPSDQMPFIIMESTALR